MVLSATVIPARTRLRTILIVMVAVIASMTMHHGAMATSPPPHDHSIAHLSLHAGESACLVECDGQSHSMPICCGMGLCLSGLPVEPQPGHLAPSLDSPGSYSCNLSPRHRSSRIDRPPKNSVRAAV